ncbi:carbohydrate-binding protein, partial [Phytohabitans aurantiacus]|uniref:carbohydrate-binding protein n=1 Tax=Phytohabitans aurantiacus TaxID=3016789 RepID=UPI002492670B
GPWTYRGTVMPRQGGSFTNHAGIVDFAGGSYFFYHNGALPGGGGFTRSVAVEKFSYNANGTIPTINMTTAGAPQIGTLNPFVRQEAETIAWESGVETEPASEGGVNVAQISNGDYIKVKGVAFGSGAASFSARVASATSGGRIEVRLDSASGPVVGTCTVPGTGGWQTWTTVSCAVSGATGTHDLFLRFAGGSGNLFNVNWWQFNETGGPTTPPPSSPPPSTPGPSGPCSATYTTTSSWSGGFQGEVTVKAGSSAISGWTVRWTLASGQTIGQVWNGTATTTGSAVTVANAPYNGALGAGASTTFGFIAGGAPSAPSLTCTSP